MSAAIGKADRRDEDALSLEVVVIYEDFATGLRAKQLLDQTAEQLPADAELKLHLWRFELLAEPALREEAVKQAVEASLVFVSAHGQAQLPEAVRLWFQEWREQSTNEPCALVVSLDGEADNAPAATQILHTWGTAAFSAGVELFLHLAETKAESDSTLDELSQRAHKRTLLLDEVLHHNTSRSFRHWGINE